MLLQATGLLASNAPDAVPTPGADLGPWLQGGGSAAAVAGLVYVARMVVKGQLVPRPVADSDAELSAAIKIAGEREALAMRLAEDTLRLARANEELAVEARAREQSMLALLGKTEHLLGTVQQMLQQRGGS